MPFDRHDFVFVLQRLDHLNFVQIDRIRDQNLRVIASTRHKVAVYRVGHAPDLLRVELLVGETLPHVEVPNRDRAVVVPDSCKAIKRISSLLPATYAP